MDTYEATKVVMSRIQSLDPENASKIMGYILIQDQGDKEIIRLAFVPDSLLQSFITQAKARLGITSNTPSSNPSTPLSNPMRPNSLFIPNNGFHFSNPSSPAFQRSSPSPRPRPFSYAAALNGGGNTSPNNSSSSSSVHFYDQLPFLDDSIVDPVMSPSGRSDSLVFPYGGDDVPSPHPFHRRSCSVNDAAFLSHLEEGGGFGWRPCMYYARGFCKNGSACKFLHGDGEAIEVGSPGKSAHGFEELLRMKALQQQRLALMASRGPHQPFGFNKCVDFLNERNDFSPMAFGGPSSSARQIYLTFPADSTFKEEDVSCYFSMFGPVQDVRIPYQQKRMFGFVTFIYPETVKLILAKGNPHFVCDSRVLVKPYKEKGKVAEKKQQQQQQQQHYLELGSSGIDSREQMDLPFGSRVLFSTQEMVLRRKLEQEAELQHALELQGRRMMNLQLMDLKNQHHNSHLLQSFRGGIPPISSPRQSQLQMNQNFLAASDGINLDNSQDFDGRQEAAKSPGADQVEGTVYSTNNNALDKQQQNVNGDDSDLPESLEHILPDNLFASPKKSFPEQHSLFSQASTSTNDSIPVTVKSCYIQMPRFPSKQEAIEM
ncbi:hypothetical protein ACS0TY_005360 [Phlomoides rotata]